MGWLLTFSSEYLTYTILRGIKFTTIRANVDLWTGRLVHAGAGSEKASSLNLWFRNPRTGRHRSDPIAEVRWLLDDFKVLRGSQLTNTDALHDGFLPRPPQSHFSINDAGERVLDTTVPGVSALGRLKEVLASANGLWTPEKTPDIEAVDRMKWAILTWEWPPIRPLWESWSFGSPAYRALDPLVERLEGGIPLQAIPI